MTRLLQLQLLEVETSVVSEEWCRSIDLKIKRSLLCHLQREDGILEV